MTPEHENQLIIKYPELFAQHGWPTTATCMSWGIETGDGWFDILDNLCASLEQLKQKKPGIQELQFTQIKEKYGALTIYTNYWWKEVESLINSVAEQSLAVCELCGLPGRINNVSWSSARCEKHDDQTR